MKSINKLNLGDSSHRWMNVYMGTNNVITTSSDIDSIFITITAFNIWVTCVIRIHLYFCCLNGLNDCSIHWLWSRLSFWLSTLSTVICGNKNTVRSRALVDVSKSWPVSRISVELCSLNIRAACLLWWQAVNVYELAICSATMPGKPSRSMLTFKHGLITVWAIVHLRDRVISWKRLGQVQIC